MRQTASAWLYAYQSSPGPTLPAVIGVAARGRQPRCRDPRAPALCRGGRRIRLRAGHSLDREPGAASDLCGWNAGRRERCLLDEPAVAGRVRRGRHRALPDGAQVLPTSRLPRRNPRWRSSQPRRRSLPLSNQFRPIQSSGADGFGFRCPRRRQSRSTSTTYRTAASPRCSTTSPSSRASTRSRFAPTAGPQAATSTVSKREV